MASEQLKAKYNSFHIIGKVKIESDTFAEAKQAANNPEWEYIRDQIPVEISEGRIVYVGLTDGHYTTRPLTKYDSEGEKHEIDWEDRFDEEQLKDLPNYSFFRAGLVIGEDGKLVRKQYLSGIDLAEYLKENLTDGTRVSISGQVEYNEYNGDVRRNYNMSSIYVANEEATNEATMSQTYLIDENALERTWKDDAKEKHEVTVSAYVPSYVSKRNGKKIGKTLPLAQSFVVRPQDEESIAQMPEFVEALFSIKRGKVREITLDLDIIEGYSTTTVAATEIDPKLAAIFKMMSQSDVEGIKSRVAVTGDRVHEVVLRGPRATNEGGTLKLMLDDDKYDTSIFDEEDYDDDEDEPSGSSEATVTNINSVLAGLKAGI
jgi:hypothetical protein